jgi:hypothetical protein
MDLLEVGEHDLMDESSSFLEEQGREQLLRTALALLALPSIEQARMYGPVCLACELLSDFQHARSVVLAKAPTLSDEQRHSLDQLELTIQTMVAADIECWNIEVIQRPIWQRLRELAVKALAAFDWSDVKVKPAVTISPGIRSGPSSEL